MNGSEKTFVQMTNTRCSYEPWSDGVPQGYPGFVLDDSSAIATNCLKGEDRWINRIELNNGSHMECRNVDLYGEPDNTGPVVKVTNASPS